MRTRLYIGIVLLLGIGMGLWLFVNTFSVHSPAPAPNNGGSSASSSSPVIIVGGSRVSVEVASSSDAIRRGLSGRTRLEEEAGMFFVFSRPDFYRFWMPDMHFPLDIIWIRDGLVVDISREISNDFDPENPVYYTPREKAQYVLEVNAGFAKRKGIEVGDPVIFHNIF